MKPNFGCGVFAFGSAIGFVLSFLSVLVASSATAAAVQAELGLVKSDIGNVAPFDDTKSKDGRFIVGWTIRADKGAKPVNWSLWTPGDQTGAMRNYIENLKNDPHFPYEVVDCVVDLVTKKAVVLPGDDPYYPGLNRRNVDAYWSSESGFPGYGLIQSQHRFATGNLWLVRIDRNGMTVVDLVKPLEQAVHKLLLAKMPLNTDRYAVSFPSSAWDDEHSTPVFHPASVDIPFTANLPKSSFDRVAGIVTVRLPESAILKVSSDTKRDDPFHDDPRLAKADEELNLIYATTYRQLDLSTRATLKKEQTEWIKKRDIDARVSDAPLAGDEREPSIVVRVRNESLLQSTLERIEELKKRTGEKRAGK